MVHSIVWCIDMTIFKKFRETPVKRGQHGEHVYKRRKLSKTIFGYSYVCPCGKTVRFKNIPDDNQLAIACARKCNEVLRIGDSKTTFAFGVK